MKLLTKCTSLLTIAVITCLVFPGKSQNVKDPLFSPVPSRATAAEFLKRPLVICKREIDAKDAEKLMKKDPDQFNAQQAYNDYFNGALELYFDSLFKGSKNIEFKSEEEVNALLKSGSSSVAVIVPKTLKRMFFVGGKRKLDDAFSFEMTLPENKDEAFIVSFTSDLLSDADFVFLVQQINSNLQKIIAGEPLPSYDYCNKNTAGKLKNLKLIVNLQKISEDLTKEEITKNYTYPIEFVDSLSDYEEIVTGQKPGYAYITCVWSETLWGPGYIAVDAATGEILSILSAGGVHISIGVKPPKTGNYSRDKYNKRFAFDVIKFKVKYELKAGHFKSFNKFVKE
jgi:hypothetical protein